MLQTVFKKLFSLREQAARRPGADDGFDPQEKPFLDHLDDLRVTLFKIITTLAISSAICFIFNKQIFQFVQIPAKSPIAEISPGITLYEKLDFFMLGPTELIFLMFKLAFYCGVIITFPFTVFFLFQFLMPGLRQSEKRTIIPGVGIGFILFLLGGSFAFFVATPLALKYFYQFENERLNATDPATLALSKPVSEIGLIGVDGEIIPPFDKEKAATAEPVPEAEAKPDSALTPQLRSDIRDYLKKTLATADGANFVLRYDQDRDKLVLVTSKGGKSSYQIGKYISFISQLVLVFGISFQMPIVVTILVKLDLLTALVMRNTRSYAWVIICVVAAILTPSPDAFTMGLLAVPLILLYEICIIIATIIERTRSRQERAEAAAEKARLEKLYLKPAAELSEEEKAELHRAEIEQYEREHAHLYQEENEHVARDSFHGEDHTNHDESWHADDHYWHDDGHHHHDDPDHKIESDHAEPEDLKPGDADAGDAGEADRDPWPNYENCAPEGPIVDLNHATLEELQTLPGIGPKMAQTIIDNRRYETFDDLDRVPGLGPEKIRRITERIMLG